MIVFGPYSTDAPLYHLPIVTGSIIAANVVLYFATTFQVAVGNMEFEQIEWLMIEFNQINPIQWLTGNFMHLSFGHLVSNMLFLFCFGLVVEGKAGNARFLAIYLSSCMLIGASSQIPMFLMGSEDLAAGASGVISTLMVIALIWAPENEISFFYWFMIFFFGTTEFRIMTISLFFIGMDIIALVLNGFSMSGAMGHTLGALMGVPIALYYLRTDKIDCEGWDLISRNDWLQEYRILYSDKQRARDEEKSNQVENPVATALALTGGDVSKSKTIGLASSPEKPEKKRASKALSLGKVLGQGKRSRKAKKVSPDEVSQQCQTHSEFNRLSYVLRQSLQSSNLPAAQSAFLRIDSLKIGPGLGESTLMQYATELVRQKQWVNAIRPLAILIDKQGALADDASLRLAQIQLRVLHRQDQAITTLQKIKAPEGDCIDAAKRERLRKRDEMLSFARGDAGVKPTQ